MRRAAVPAVMIVALAAATVLPAPLPTAAAQVSGTGRISLSLTSISGVVRPGGDAPGGGDLTLRVLVENESNEPITDLTVLTEIFGHATSRSALHAAVDANNPRGLLEGEAVDVREGAALEPGDVAGIEVAVEESRVGWGPGNGVHPVRISVLQGRSVLDEIGTAVIALREAPAVRLATVMGWPLDAAPWRFADGTFPPDTPVEARTGGRLERLVWAVEQTDADVQPLIATHVLEDLSDMATGYRTRGGRTVPAEEAQTTARLAERLTAVLSKRSNAPVASPYADADLSALLDAEFRHEALLAVTEGRRRLEEVLDGRPLPDAMWATTRLTHAALRDVLAPSRTRTLVLGWDQFATDPVRAKPDTTPAAVQGLFVAGVEVSAVVADPWLQDLVTDLPDEDGPAAAVQRVLAETAMVHLERPNDPSRGLVVLPPPAWDPDPRVAAELLGALSNAPWLDLVGVNALLSRVEPRPRPGSLGTVAATAIPRDVAGGIRATRDRLGALQAALPDHLDGVAGRSWQDLERTVLRAPSMWWLGGDVTRASAHLDAVLAAISEGFGPITLPVDARITFTDTEGAIPVTVARADGPPIRVRVRLEAPPRLELPDGNEREIRLEAGASQTISFAAIVNASGRIPVTVRVESGGDPDVAVELAEETVVVQSTAISGTALIVLGGMVALLLVWWLYRRLRPRRPDLTLVNSGG